MAKYIEVTSAPVQNLKEKKRDLGKTKKLFQLRRFKKWWNSLDNIYIASSGYELAKKLQALKGKIRDLNRNVIGKINHKCEQNYLLIQWLDQKIDEDDISENDVITHDNLMLESENLDDMKEQFWRDKSRIQWNEEGDRKTNYYHRIAKTDIMKVVKDFENSGKTDWRLKSTFLALILKKQVVEEIKDLRPISLTSTIYKAISKILVERLKVMLPKLVSSQQSAYVKGRKFLDNILVANECLESRLKLGTPGSSSLFVLVNGSAYGKFTLEKGLLQGDPLYPFIFLFVSEVLTMMFFKAETDSLLGGFLSSSYTNAVKVSHLQFADDTLVFLDDNVDQVRNLKYILLWYQCISGLKTNFSKCNLFGVGNVQDIEGMAEIMGCSCDCFPTQYLGMPLGDKSNTASKWDRIVEICKARLASWKRKTLSRAGKLTLIKSVLQSIPIYYLSLFMAPSKVIKSIEKVIRDFLWDKSTTFKKHHWVGWRNVCKSLKVGGLDIRSLKNLNKSLLHKWWWRPGNEPEALWSRVVKDKHDIADLGWRTKQPKEKHGVSLWRNIFSTAEDFFKHCQFKIGKGYRVRLWEDKWCLQGPLSALCPILYNLSISKNISIMDAFLIEVDGFRWNLGLNHRRRLCDTEITELYVAILLVESIVLVPDTEDQLIWLGDKKGVFSVKTAYKNYSQCTFPIIRFPSSKVWSRAWPHRVGFFLWQVCLNRLPTLSNLHHRNSTLDSSNLCYLCGLVEENEDHLLLQCTADISVWNYLITNFVGDPCITLSRRL
ncbi:uncharacterized protein LOC113273346 [Papaver somniferum]|uniref:uncharacterized protein LOC113273346 n=1 Tax=Papaver somniferum TaxID=3469 RepID=UPI000E6F7E99|nr:uncharacterized protein LOC113273346 [Papaver somniferum]